MSADRRSFIKGAGAAATVALAGCNSDGGAETATTDGTGGSGTGSTDATTGTASEETIDFHFVAGTPATATQEALTGAVEAWGEQLDGYDVNPTMEFVGFVEASQTLNTYLGTGNPPDLVMGTTLLGAFHRNLVDVSTFLDDHDFDLPSEAYSGPVNDKHVVIPDNFAVQTKYYRKDLYEEAGVEPPETWEEQLSAAELLAGTIPEGMRPEMIMANPSSTATYLQNHTTFHTLGVDYLERTGPDDTSIDDVRVSLGDETERQTAIDILSHYQQMYQYSPETVNYGVVDMIQTYLQGQVATTTATGRLIDNALANRPEFLENTGVTMFPLPSDTDSYRVAHDPKVIVVPDTGRSDLAFQFLDFYLGSDHYIKRLLGAGPNSVPITQELLNDDRLQSDPAWDNPLGQEYREQLNGFWDDDDYYMATYGRTDPASLYWPTVCNGSLLIDEMAANGVIGRTSPTEAVDQAVPKLKDRLQTVVQDF